MNWEQFGCRWKEMRARVQAQWARLTDEDLEGITGHRDEIVNQLQQRYGFVRDDAERALDSFVRNI